MEEKNTREVKKDPVIENPEKHKSDLQAFEEAEQDIEKEPGMDLGNKNDLDEGELARKEGHP